MPERGPGDAPARESTPPADTVSSTDTNNPANLTHARSVIRILLSKFERYPQSGRRVVENQAGTVQFGARGHQRQSQSRARDLARLVEPHAPAQNELALVRGYPRS